MNQITALQTSGSVDPLFGINGEAPMPADARAALALSDNKLLIATMVSGSVPFRVARFTTDGLPDVTFGTNGVVAPALPPRVAPIPGKMIELSNGKYLIACSQRGASDTLYLFQMLSSGLLDAAFGVAGIAIYKIVDIVGVGNSGGLQAPGAVSSIGDPCLAISEPNGTIYMGSSFSSDENIKGIVFGLNLDGSPKLSFNGGHILIEDTNNRVRIDSLAATGQGVLIAGAIIAASANEGKALVARYDQHGVADPSFGNNGKVAITGNNGQLLSLTSLTLRPNGAILASGYARNNDELRGLVTVLNGNGSFNLVFNRGAPLYPDFVDNLILWACTWQQDAQIVVTGLGDDGCLVISRYNPDGSLDSTFGDDGWAIYVNKPNSRYEDSVLTADGKVVMLGTQAIQHFAVRYLLS